MHAMRQLQARNPMEHLIVAGCQKCCSQIPGISASLITSIQIMEKQHFDMEGTSKTDWHRTAPAFCHLEQLIAHSTHGLQTKPLANSHREESRFIAAVHSNSR